EAVFPLADLPLDGARARPVGGGGELGDDRFDIAGIEDRKAALQSQRRRFLANDAQAEAVKCRDRELRSDAGAAKRLLGTLAHFTRSLVREGDRDDLRRLDAAIDEVRDLRGDDARLAAARAGEHEQRRAVVTHRVALRVIQRKPQGGSLLRDIRGKLQGRSRIALLQSTDSTDAMRNTSV